MFIIQEIHYSDMSSEFQAAEDAHFEALPTGFDDALFYDCTMLFFGL